MRSFSRIWISLGLASRHPYGFTTRVKPDSKWSGPAVPFHSIVTGTREFMRGPRRLLLIRMSSGRSSLKAILIGSPQNGAEMEWSPQSSYWRETHRKYQKELWSMVRKDRWFCCTWHRHFCVAQTLLSVLFGTGARRQQLSNQLRGLLRRVEAWQSRQFCRSAVPSSSGTYPCRCKTPESDTT